MTPDQVRQIAAWLEASGLGTLELTAPEMRLRLALGAEAGPAVGPPPPSPAALPSLDARATGIFLPAHPWRDAPIVRPGQRVRAGEIVALLRIGPLLQPVTAATDGVVGRSLAAAGALVGFGAPLMEFIPDAPQESRAP